MSKDGFAVDEPIDRAEQLRKPGSADHTCETTTNMSDDRASELKGPSSHHYLLGTYSYVFLYQPGWLLATRTSENPGCEPWRPV